MLAKYTVPKQTMAMNSVIYLQLHNFLNLEVTFNLQYF